MVMHARKYPRHNDGYYERNQTHPFEEKYPSKSNSGSGGSAGPYYDRYGDRPSKDAPTSYNRVRDESPSRPNQRYQNKSSYKERTKERIDKGSSNSPGDRGLNHYHNVRSDGDRHASSAAATSAKPVAFKSLESLKSAEPKDPKTEQIQKSALRVSGDWSEHRSSSGKRYYYNCKSEVSQWEKPKDWIDLSANLGRPMENTASSRGKDRNGRDVRNTQSTATSSKPTDDRYKHCTGNMLAAVSGNYQRGSTGGGPGQLQHYTPASTAGSAAYTGQTNTGNYMSMATDHHRQSQHPASHRAGVDSATGEHRERAELRKSWSMPDRYGEYHHHQPARGSLDAGSGRGETGLQRIPVVCRSSSSGLQEGASNHGGQGSGGPGVPQHRGQRQRLNEEQHHGHHHHHRHGGENHHHVHYHKGGTVGPAFNGARHPGDHMPRNENEDSRQTEDMDISPGSTPTSSRPNSHLGTPIPNSTHSAMTSSLTAATQSIGSNDLTQQAIQTLQKLQAALMAQQHQLQQQQQTTNTTVSQSPRSAVDVTPPHQPHYVASSPQVNNTGGHGPAARVSLTQQLSQVDEDSRESQRSDRSVRSSRYEVRGSPTPSVASSQSVSLSGSSLGVANKKQDSVQLTPSLSNYYNDALIEHCANLPADQAERQANRYGEEAHSVGTLHCTQVSVDLKRARSLVRIAEIQATLQEQRILFLRQQTRDLDNMRSQNSFMPSQHDP